MVKRNFVLLALVGGFGVFLFYSPQLDQWLAIIPFNESSGRFYGEVSPWCKFIYSAIQPWITLALILLPILMLIFQKKITSLTSRQIKRVATIMLIALVIGPGLLVNAGLKENWGRPRPYQVIRDGETFSPVWQPHWGEHKNNSLPSGHVAIGAFLGVPLLALGYRKKGVVISLLGAAFVSIVRIAQGGHYLTDVIWSWILVWLSAELVTYVTNRLDKKGIFGE
ncbi:MAG: phosphatase PAP2 family protein [Burkholderiales bacterium]